jgi:hypothetical protein
MASGAVCDHFPFSGLQKVEAAAGPVNVVPFLVPASKHTMPDEGRGRVKAAPM